MMSLLHVPRKLSLLGMESEGGRVVVVEAGGVGVEWIHAPSLSQAYIHSRLCSLSVSASLSLPLPHSLSLSLSLSLR